MLLMGYVHHASSIFAFFGSVKISCTWHR